MKIVNDIIQLFHERGNGLYFGEAITETQHALQTAHLATISGSSDQLIAASLLHDIGHLLHQLPEDIAAYGHDAQHEELGAVWLREHVQTEVVQPVLLHVAAKRYLCATDSEYLGKLSPASVQSLHLQGGLMSAEEQAEFEQQPGMMDAIQLRRFDDMAKVVGWMVPPIETYRDVLERVLLKGDVLVG